MNDKTYENYLAHHGVLGMRWGVRKEPVRSGNGRRRGGSRPNALARSMHNLNRRHVAKMSPERRKALAKANARFSRMVNGRKKANSVRKNPKSVIGLLKYSKTKQGKRDIARGEAAATKALQKQRQSKSNRKSAIRSAKDSYKSARINNARKVGTSVQSLQNKYNKERKSANGIVDHLKARSRYSSGLRRVNNQFKSDSKASRAQYRRDLAKAKKN